MKKEKMEKLSQNASVAGVVTALATAVFTFILGIITGGHRTEVKYHDAVTYNNISSYIDNLMVKSGLINENILLLDNPFDQISMIAETMTEQQQITTEIANDRQSNYNDILATIREYLIASGKNKVLVNEYTQDELLNELEYVVMSAKTIRQENKDLTIELNDLKEQTTAILSSPDIKILGEDTNTTLIDYVASIDGHTYYSENLLNTFLPEKISYDNGMIQYGENVPERVNVISQKLIHDDSGVLCYNGNSHFAMGLREYSNGIVKKAYSSGSLKIACDKKYSQLSFTLGHIDNSGADGTSLSISYMDSNGEYQETFYKNLYQDMPVDSFSVPIYNTETVKIEIPYINGGQYGLADVYLIK